MSLFAIFPHFGLQIFKWPDHKSSSRDELDLKNKFPDLAGYTPLKYVISGKPLIAPEPED
jgi:hypothetical protein